jgi:hypothetical protein
LQDYGRGYRVQLATLSKPAQVATLSSHDGFRLASRQPLIPHLNGQSNHALRHAAEVLRAPGLATLRAVGIERQSNHDVAHAFAPREVEQGVEHWRQPVTAIEHTPRGGQHTSLVAQRDANSPLAGVDAEHSPLAHLAGYFGPWTLTSTRNARGAHEGVTSTLGGSASPLNRAR